MFEVYYCPNFECSNEGKLEKSGKCSVCGTESAPFGIKDTVNLFIAKDKYKRAIEKKDAPQTTQKNSELLEINTSEEALFDQIDSNLEKMKQFDMDKGIIKLNRALNSSPTENLIISLLHMITLQNNILILQNELALRQKEPEKSKST